MVYTLEKHLFVPVSKAVAWDFISNPANLNRITPEDMDFEIVTDLPETMVEGMLVEYRVQLPLIGRQTWVSELKHIVEQQSFVDEQKVGPYAFWYHYHGIEAAENGVLLTDRVCYAPPFGILGRMAHGLLIGRTLERIFEHREKAFRQILCD